MPTCVALQADGTLLPTGEAADVCSGYVLMSGSEHAMLQFLNDIFAWPTPEVLSGWMVAAFGFVLTMNAAGYIVGAVVKMVSTDRH